MEPKTIVIIVVVLIILYYFYSWVTNKSTSLSSLREGSGKGFKPNIEIEANKLSKSGGSNNFTYSIWIYIDNWNINAGKDKVIFERGTGTSASPKVYLDKWENNLTIALNVYVKGGGSPQPETSTISNVPLQKWVNVIYSVYGRTLDTYLDGKLVKTNVLAGTVKIDDSKSIILFPTTTGDSASFGGKITTFKYWPMASNPQEAWDIYTSGYGSNIFGNLLDKYRLQVSFLTDGVEKTSFQI